MTEVERARTYIILSLIAGALVLAIALLGRDAEAEVGAMDRWVLVGSLLLASTLGITMVLRPNWRSRDLPLTDISEGTEALEGSPQLPPPPRKGHHPECERFTSHTVAFRGKVRCAGCTGLGAGAFTVILLTLAYAAFPSFLERLDGIVWVLVGMTLVALDLGGATVGIVEPRAKLGLNALMVVGFALLSIGLLEGTGRLAWGLVGVVMAILWMETRIQISQRNHATVCAACPEECVAYSF